MMSVWNLLWIVPLAGGVGAMWAALWVAASRGDEEDDDE